MEIIPDFKTLFVDCVIITLSTLAWIEIFQIGNDD